MSVVQIENVFKEYKLGEQLVHALKNISLSIDDGVFLAIAGPSGSGKSTILNLIGCIDTPSQGKISVNGQDVSGQTPDQLADMRARTIGFIFQTFNLFPVLSAKENVEYPLLRIKELSAGERSKRVNDYLGIVGLSKYGDHRPNQLSGGQRQRVAIARALAAHPKIVLADEPTANLDHATGDGILQLMKEINRESKTTFIFSTHDSRVMTMADRLVRVEDGVMTSSGLAEKVSPVAVVREKILKNQEIKSLGIESGSSPSMALREQVSRYLFLENNKAYMAAPWHINTEAGNWVINSCFDDVDASALIREQLSAHTPFYVDLHRLVLMARQQGIKVEGWPA